MSPQAGWGSPAPKPRMFGTCPVRDCAFIVCKKCSSSPSASSLVWRLKVLIYQTSVEPVIQSEVSQKNKCRLLMQICGIEKNGIPIWNVPMNLFARQE